MTTHRVHVSHRGLAVGLALTLALTLAPIGPAGAAVDPSVDAQQFIYELNRARWSPVLYSIESGVTMPVVAATPPVAPEGRLQESSAFKANEMAANDYFAHQSAVTGLWPNRLARDFGYPIPAEWPDDDNYLESLHSGSPDPYSVLGSFANSPTHRVHVFGENGFGAYTEIGVGRSSTSNYWAVHLARRSTPVLMVTGVVFDDRDGDRRMDLGEGLAGVVVTTGGSSAVTNAGGGYALPLTPGESVIAATMDGITSEGHFTAGAYSVGVDFVKGASRPVIRAYELCEGSPPTILGTDGDDTITGTAGDDIIHGLAGNDTIAGGGGTDIICGGDGVDVINGVADAAVVSSSAPTTTSSTTVAPPPVINLDIRRGARGTTVRQLQSMLNSAGFPVGRADGIFGAKTQAAVSRFQGSKSLPQTGWVDGMTWTTLQALVSAPPPVAAIPAVATIAIRKGARGAMVAQLQTMLNATGFSVGRADGIFGLKTQSAVSRFQASRSLPQTGLVDAATWAVLQAAFAPVP